MKTCKCRGDGYGYTCIGLRAAASGRPTPWHRYRPHADVGTVCADLESGWGLISSTAKTLGLVSPTVCLVDTSRKYSRSVAYSLRGSENAIVVDPNKHDGLVHPVTRKPAVVDSVMHEMGHTFLRKRRIWVRDEETVVEQLIACEEQRCVQGWRDKILEEVARRKG